MFQKMIYKKRPESAGEVVILLGTFKGTVDNKLYATIMHNPDSAVCWKDMPYEVVKLNRLRPTTEDFNKVFSH